MVCLCVLIIRNVFVDSDDTWDAAFHLAKSHIQITTAGVLELHNRVLIPLICENALPLSFPPSHPVEKINK